MYCQQPVKLPFLEFLGWQIADVYRLSQSEMLANYERGWRYRISQRLPAYFGGGTLLALDLGEYRTSNDIDFICAVGADYRQLRNTIGNHSPQTTLLRPNSELEVDRFTTDQYGIRMSIIIDGIPIKTEIIAEARFSLDPPRKPSWSPVECLSITDCFASKLLANADRYSDPGVYARDLIDLAFLRNQQPIPASAIDKAEAAYSVMAPLQSALIRFQTDSDLRSRCYENLAIDQSFQAQLINGIDLLAMDLNMKKTARTISESGDEIFPSL